MSQVRKLLKMRRFCLLQTHCDWLHAQHPAGMDDDGVVQAAVGEFLNALEEEERQRWIADARVELPRRIATIDVIINAARAQFRRRHAAEFLEAP